MPPLWPGQDPDHPSRYSGAGSGPPLDDENWTDHATLIDGMTDRFALQRKTVTGLLAQAGRNRLIQRQGHYSHKKHTDTRQYRRHPKPHGSCKPEVEA